MANEIADTQLAATKMEVISEIAQRALISESAILASVRDVSMFAQKGAKSISFPKNTSLFAVEKRASGIAGTNQALAFGKDTMNLSERAHIQWLVDSDDEIESRLNVQQELIERAAKEHARSVDADLIAELEAAGITTTTIGAISQDLVLEMRRVLLRNKANPRDLYLAVSPEDEALLLKIDPFVSADKYGSSAIPSGVLGLIYGVKVIMTPELAGNQYFMYASEGCAIGFQRQPQFDESPQPQFGAGSKLQVLTQKYGVLGQQIQVPGGFKADGVTALAATESAWIVKDNNL